MMEKTNDKSVACPFCGELMETPLRFCVACGRPITAEDLKRSGLKLSSSRVKTERLNELSRRDYSFHRKTRTLMYTLSAVLAILLGYYVTMKYVLHEHMPGNLDVKIEQLLAGSDASTPVDAAQPTGR